MTFPTAAAMITRRKSLGISTGPAAIAIYLLPIAWLYRFIASWHAHVLDRPAANASSPVAIVFELKSTVLQRPVSRPPPSACRLGNDDKRYHCAERDLIRLSARHGVFACDRMRAAAAACAAPHACPTILSTGERAARRLGPLG